MLAVRDDGVVPGADVAGGELDETERPVERERPQDVARRDADLQELSECAHHPVQFRTAPGAGQVAT